MAFTRSGVRSPSPPLSTRAQPTGSGAQTHGGTQAAGGRLDSGPHAGIAQLVEHNLAKVGVAGSSPVSRSGPARRGGAVWEVAGLVTRRSRGQRPPPPL